MMISSVEVVTGCYYDSVRLMQASRELADMPGVDSVLMGMATDLNVSLLGDMGFDRDSATGARPDDLLVAIRAEEAAMPAVRGAVDQVLSTSPAPRAEALFARPRSRTVAAAGRSIAANVALISVPGPYAFVEAMDALGAGMHVMVFSDNVPIEYETLLKDEAASRGLLVMGPDCGTAIVNGLGLGFANVVQPGPVAITGASGTGIQQLCCLLDFSGVGVRHALGTGSRDLSTEVGARSTLQALAAFDSDPEVEVVILVSKPPDPDVATRVRAAVARCTTPVVTALLGAADVTLEQAARAAVGVLGVPWVDPPVWEPAPRRTRPGFLRGLFSGGTLRDEAHAIAGPVLGGIGVDPGAPGHWLVDFGADRYTRGRPHPMIDPTLKLEVVADTIDDPATGTLLVDVVLGFGSQRDPAGEMAPLVARASDQGIAVVISMCGTRGDIQGIDRQATLLRDAGAEVYASNAAGATRGVAIAEESRR